MGQQSGGARDQDATANSTSVVSTSDNSAQTAPSGADTGDVVRSNSTSTSATNAEAEGKSTGAEIEQTPSWFDFGGMATSLAQSARHYIPPAIEGVASAIHQSALNVAAELAEMERQEADEEFEWEQQQKVQEAVGSDDGDNVVMLPWQINPNGNTAVAQDDKELKRKILALSLDVDVFKTPYDGANGDDGCDKDSNCHTPYLDQHRVAVIKRLLHLDPNLAQIHANLSSRSEVKETIFWKNYFHHCDQIRAEHLVHDDELDAEVVLQTPPPSPAAKQRERIPRSPPKVLSIDDLVLVGIEGDDEEDWGKLAADSHDKKSNE